MHMGLPGHYKAPWIKYLIVLAHSATHPFRNESARETIVGSTSPFSAKTGDLKKRRYFLALFSLADTTLSQPGHLQSLLLAPAWSNRDHVCTPIWEKFWLLWHVTTGNPAAGTQQGQGHGTAQGAEVTGRQCSKGPAPHVAQLHIWHSTHRQASELSQSQLQAGHTLCPATQSKESS